MINNYDVAVLSEKVAYLENALKTAGVLPEVSASDNGKALQVINGAWASGIDLTTAFSTLTDSVTPEVVTGFSLDPTNVNSEGSTVIAYRIGKIIFVNILAITAKIDLAGAVDLITGLPKPNVNTTAVCWGETASNPIPVRLRAREDGDNGKISLWYDNIATGKGIAGTVIYIEA